VVYVYTSWKNDILDEVNEVNKKVVEKVKSKCGLNPRTRVVGFTRDTFSVDIYTGNIYILPDVDKDALEGYLTHENGHRVAFPVSSAGAIAFTSAVASYAPDATVEEVKKATRIVTDAFSDYILYRVGLGQELIKRLPDFERRIKIRSVSMAFKMLVYKSIESAEKRNSKYIDDKDLDSAYKKLQKVADPNIVKRAYEIAAKFLNEAEKVLNVFTPNEIASFLLNPFKAGLVPKLTFLAEIAAELIKADREVRGNPPEAQQPSQCNASGGASGSVSGSSTSGSSEKDVSRDKGREGSQANEQKKDQQGGDGKHKNKEPNRGEERGNEGKGGHEKDDEDRVEGADVAITKMDIVDVRQAVRMLNSGFGVHLGMTSLAIESVYSEKIREAVKSFLEKVKLVFAQNDFKLYKPSGFEKKQSDLWLKPKGEPDEDSVLMEPRKLLWKVSYHVPHPRGRLTVAPASVPKNLIIVQDESASTDDEFYGASVASAEAFMSLVVLGGLRYKGGAKNISVLKFSYDVEETYKGNDEVTAGVKVILPHAGAGGGTNIEDAVEAAIWRAEKNTAIVVVTDALITDDVAENVGKSLRHAIDVGKVGFVVFLVVNKEDEPSIEIIRKELSGKNAVVGHVKNADDLVQTANGIMNHILKVYSMR